MRIALVIPGGVDRGGRERVIPVLLDLIERLARRHKVTVIALHQEAEPSRYLLLGATVVNLGAPAGPGAALRWWQRYRGVTDALRAEGGVDVIHAIWIFGPGMLAVAAGRALGVPVVVTISGGELTWLPEIQYGSQGRWRTRIATSAVLKRAQAVTGNSHFALQPCKQRGDAIWLPLGVNRSNFTGSADRPCGPPWRLIHVATLNRVKDQTVLLEALRLVLQQEKEVHLDCIGEDTLGGEIQRKARDLGLDHAVTFHGFMPTDMLVPFYRRSHLLVQSSLHEAGGAAVTEAAAAGVAVVGTSVGILADMAPEAAVAVRPKDPEALAEAIVALLRDPACRLQVARAGQQFAHTHDADWTAAQFERIYTRLVDRTAAPGKEQ